MKRSRRFQMLALVAFGLAALLPSAASATATHTAADWFASCAGGFPLGDRNEGLGTASVDWTGGVDGTTGLVLAAGVSAADLTTPTSPQHSYEGSISFSGSGLLANACNLSAGAIGVQKYSIQNSLNPGATSASLDISFQVSGSFTGDFSKGSANFGLNLYYADATDPLNGPQPPIASLFCQTAAPFECSNNGFDLSGLSTVVGSNSVVFSGSIADTFDAPIGESRIGVTTFGSLALDSGIQGPATLLNDFGDTITWRIAAIDPNVSVVPVPEAGTGALLGAALVAIGWTRRRRR